MQKTLLYLLMFSIGMLVFSCEKSEGPGRGGEKTAEEQALEKLTGGSNITWAVANGGSVTKDGHPVTADYAGFELQLIASSTNKTYRTTANPVFDQSGTWSLVGGNYDKIQLTGNQPAAGKEISFSRHEDKLTLRFNIPLPNGRTTALAGSYVFELVRK